MFGEVVGRTMSADPEVARFAQQLTGLQRQLYVYLSTLVERVGDVDDLLQEVNKVAWEKYSEFTPGSNLSAWAYRIAYFEVLRYRKSKGRDRLRFGDDTLELLAVDARSIAERECQRREALLDCLEKLSAEDRRLITRRYHAEMDVEGLAVETGRSDKSIYRALARIRSLLHACIQRTLAAEAQS